MTTSSRQQNKPNVLVRTLLGVTVITVVAALLMWWINSSEPQAEREPSGKRTAMLVETMPVQRATYTPQIEGLGKVQAAKEITLRPEVAGRVTRLSNRFSLGQIVDKGATLLELNAADQRNTIKQLESSLIQAKSALAVEMGQRDIAKQEYKLLNKRIPEKNRALILREPQLAAARANVSTAETALAQAKLDFSRTNVKAPFTAQVVSRMVNVGSQVSTSTDLGRLVGVDVYWVVVNVPVAQLQQLDIPRAGGSGLGAWVSLHDRTAWSASQRRRGRVIGLLGELQADTRLARVLVRVDDPLALNERNQNALDNNPRDNNQIPALLIDSLLHASIAGKPLENVYRIPREYLHDSNTLWLNRDNKLLISSATVVFKDATYAYLSDGIMAGDTLITSSLSTIAPDTPLRVANQDTDNVDDSNDAANAMENNTDVETEAKTGTKASAATQGAKL